MRRNKGLSTEDSCCRISAESHESIHAKINKAKEVVKRIASLMQMYQTLYAIATSNLKPSVANLNDKVAKKTTSKSRGKYNTHRESKQSDEVEFSKTIFEDSVSVDGKDYLLIKGGG